MLPQTISVPTAGVSHASRLEKATVAWDAIDEVLRRRGVATTKAIAEETGLAPYFTQARLEELRELGEVRHAASRQGVRGRSWELGAEAFAARDEAMKPAVVPAVQLGTFHRDPLVAALFGPAGGEVRCVSCARPQGVPHAPFCQFNGLDIDAAHKVLAQ